MKKVYNYVIIRRMSFSSFRTSTATILLLTLTLSACRSDKGPSVPVMTEGPVRAVTSIARLFVRKSENPRPSPMLGLFVTLYVEKGTAFGSTTALRGIGAQTLMLEGDRMSLDDTFKLLQELGASLQINVPDLLNRSENRAQALNEYTTSLTDTATRSQTRTDAMEAELDALRDRQRTERETATKYQREVDTAIRDKDFATAGSQQKVLTEAQAALAKTDSEIDRMRDIVDAFKKMLEIAKKRVAAIEENRQILIAGLSVVELPGVEDLELIKQPESGNRGGGFNPFGGL